MTVSGDGQASATASPPPVLVMMGVTGSGKSTLGEVLAARLGWPFKEGDDLHPLGNIDKMRHGVPLDDADRIPWLRAIAEWIDRWRHDGSPGVISCSALKRAYRSRLDAGRPQVIFVYLQGDAATLAARLAARRGHFMPPSLLTSQLAALEPPDADEPAVTVPIEGSVDQQVADTLRQLTEAGRLHKYNRGPHS